MDLLPFSFMIIYKRSLFKFSKFCVPKISQKKNCTLVFPTYLHFTLFTLHICLTSSGLQSSSIKTSIGYPKPHCNGVIRLLGFDYSGLP